MMKTRESGSTGSLSRARSRDPLLADEDVDVRAQAATLVAHVERKARRDLLHRAHDLGQGPRLDLDLLALEPGEEGVEVPSELDAGHTLNL